MPAPIVVPFSSASFRSIRSSKGGMPCTGRYLWFSGSLKNSTTPSAACGGGPYETTPCPSEIVPGWARIISATTGITGDCTASRRAETRRALRGSDSGETKSFMAADILAMRAASVYARAALPAERSVLANGSGSGPLSRVLINAPGEGVGFRPDRVPWAGDSLPV